MSPGVIVRATFERTVFKATFYGRPKRPLQRRDVVVCACVDWSKRAACAVGKYKINEWLMIGWEGFECGVSCEIDVKMSEIAV